MLARPFAYAFSLFLFLLTLDCREPEQETQSRLALWINDPPVLPRNVKFEYKATDCETPTGNPNDPLFGFQWHLKNSGQAMFASIHSAGTAGEDINVLPAWARKASGNKVLVSVIDDGVFLDHEDLLPNVVEGSYNFVSATNFLSLNNPGGEKAIHGTAVAGIIAARANNSLGISGVAPCSNLIGYNYLEAATDVNLVLALSENKTVEVSNNSWGAIDGTGQFVSAPNIFYETLEVGLARGRNEKGTSYVFAGGNGAGRLNSTEEVDFSVLDGYANHIGVIAVGGVLNTGKRANFSEKGANLLVSAYTGRDGEINTAITTTDAVGILNNWGYNPGGDIPTRPITSSYNYKDTRYTSTFNGTSAATPMVSGVISLLYEKYPNLTWRDVRKILAQSARVNDPSDTGWIPMGGTSNYPFNTKYGFGVINADRALEVASSFSSLGGSSSLKKVETTVTPGTSIPEGSASSTSLAVANSKITKIEYIEIFLSSDHPNQGELRIELEAPSTGVKVEILEPRKCYTAAEKGLPIIDCTPMANQKFGVSAFLDYPADGNWKLNVTDSESNSKTGKLDSIRFVLYGS